MRDCAHDICLLINEASDKKVYEPILKKYSTKKFLRVAEIPIRIRESRKKQRDANSLNKG